MKINTYISGSFKTATDFYINKDLYYFIRDHSVLTHAWYRPIQCHEYEGDYESDIPYLLNFKITLTFRNNSDAAKYKLKFG